MTTLAHGRAMKMGEGSGGGKPYKEQLRSTWRRGDLIAVLSILVRGGEGKVVITLVTSEGMA